MNIKKKRPEINNVLSVILANMNITEEEFFDTDKEYIVNGIKDAATMIRESVSKKEMITVVGDYDADGVDASAIMKMLLSSLGANITIRLPKRFSEGYGLSTKIIDEIKSGLLITVDNGIVAVDAIKMAKDKGIKVIVIDHHLGLPDGTLPPADIIIDPNAIENSATFNSYCGAGLAYKLAVEMLGNDHYLIPKLQCFAAIGTIADVMPLIEDNRRIVIAGLKAMTTKFGPTTGLQALLERCGLNERICAKDIAFKIGPIINACGRIYDDGAMLALMNIVFDGDMARAYTLAETLDNINNDRKELVKQYMVKMEENITDNCLFGDIPMTIYEPGLPEGLVGIFAGHIAEKYKVPCIVLTDSDNPDILKGSARSYGGIHLKNLLDANADKIYKYGGHAEAAGLSVEKSKFDELKNSLIDTCPEIEISDDTIYYDLEISADKVPDMINTLDKYAPYGEGCPEIVFKVTGFDVKPCSTGFAKYMGADKQHIKLFGKDSTAVGFDMAKKFAELGNPKRVDIVGTLSVNMFGGYNKQIEMIDFEDTAPSIPKTDMANLLSTMAQNRYNK